MGIPTQIQQQVEEADRIMREIGLNTGEPAQEAPVSEEVSAPPSAEDHEAESIQEEVAAQTDSGVTGTEESIGQVDAGGVSGIPEETWQQKYIVLQGKYQAEVPRLYDTIRELKSRMTALESAPTVQQEQQPAQSASRVDAVPVSDPVRPAGLMATELDASKYDDFGEEIGGMARNQSMIVKDLVAQQVELQALRKEISDLKGSTQSVVQTHRETQSQRFYSYLDANVPGWEATRDNPVFDQWLNTRDVISGLSFGQCLSEALKSSDPVRVAGIFKMYQQSTEQQNPKQSVPQPTQQVGKPPAVGQPVSVPGRNIAPDRNQTGFSPSTSGQSQVSHSEYRDAGTRRALGHITEDEFKRIESAYLASLSGGKRAA
jgi:hypothetical protein